MTKTNPQRNLPPQRQELCRSSFPRRLGVGAVVVPLLWGASGCSSSDETPRSELQPSTTSGPRPSGGATGVLPSTGGTTSDATQPSMAGGSDTAGEDTRGGGNDDSDIGAGASAADTQGAGASDTTTATVSDTGAHDTGSSEMSASHTGDSDTGGIDAGSTSSNGSNGDSSSGGNDDTSGADGGTSPGAGDALSPGCGTAFQDPPPDGEQQTAEIDGSTRYYLLDVPDDADNETPLMLIFALHGFDMNNIAVVDLFNFTERSNGQAITVWPQGEGPHPGDVEHWGDQVLQSTWTPNEQNYAFIQRLITDLGERYCIDQRRIFITGFSMGGFFTNQIACDHADWFRGFAPVAGGGPQSCANPDVQSAIMVQHGTADDIVQLSSGEGSRDFWRDQNSCSPSSSTSLANCEFYDGCAEGKPVAWCTGNYDHYIPDEVASNIWSFFSNL